MPTETSNDEFLAELESLGEAEVRLKLLNNGFTKGTGQIPVAQEWLKRKAVTRQFQAEARNEASNLEQIRIARSAKNAAWIAAIAAIAAAISAVIALLSS